MLINLQQYKKRKQLQTEVVQVVRVPVYERIYVEGDELIGEFSTGAREVITEYKTE